MSRPRIYEEHRITTAVRLPESLHDWLKATARERDVSVTYLVVRALEDYRKRIAPLTSAPAGSEG
jgi:predicted DNA-binding ribbon-helix-helix protein